MIHPQVQMTDTYRLRLITFMPLILFLCGCHSAFITKFDNTPYAPTTEVKIYSDLSTVPGEYFEIGYVEAKGGVTVSKQILLDDMISQARTVGADALIKVQFYDRVRYDPNLGTYEKPAAKAIMIRFRSRPSK